MYPEIMMKSAVIARPLERMCYLDLEVAIGKKKIIIPKCGFLH